MSIRFRFGIWFKFIKQIRGAIVIVDLHSRITDGIQVFTTPVDPVGEITLVRGTVIEGQRWSETHVSGSGGGVVIGGYGAMSSSVKSNVKNKQEIWLELENGQQMQFVLNADKFAARPNQRLSVAVYRNVENNKRTVISYYNHDTDLHFDDDSGIINKSAAILIFMVVFSFTPLVIITVPAMMYWGYKKIKNHKKYKTHDTPKKIFINRVREINRDINPENVRVLESGTVSDVAL